MWQTTSPSADTLDELHAVIFDLLGPTSSAAIPTAIDHAYGMIWRQLIKGERRPGERLSDTEIAVQLGLSRTPVRQALYRLSQEELVRFDPRRGFSVQTFTATDVREIYSVRGALEVLALRLAAPRLTTENLETHLRELYVARAALLKAPGRRADVLHLESDLRLHNLLIRASGNGRLLRTLAALRSQQTLFQYWDTSYPRRNEAASREHERILLALIAGDVDEAAAGMADHISNAGNRVLTDMFGSDAANGAKREPAAGDRPATASTEQQIQEGE